MAKAVEVIMFKILRFRNETIKSLSMKLGVGHV